MDIHGFIRRKMITQTELAKALDITPANVNKWFSGRGVPSYEICKKLLEMGMSVKELFDLDYVDPSAKEKEILSPAEIVRKGILELAAEFQKAEDEGREGHVQR